MATYLRWTGDRDGVLEAQHPSFGAHIYLGGCQN